MKEYIDNEQFEYFNKNTKSVIDVKTSIESKRTDTSWIDLVERCIPYIDTIMRNPRRFIVQEEDIVPIEKVKWITEESVKHLAQHTNLIHHVDEDDNVTPSKLLNVYREETTNLYENRFIKSLVDNLYIFVNDKLKESDQTSFIKTNNIVVYNAETKTKNDNVKISVSLESFNKNNLVDEEKEKELQKKIETIKEVVESFKGSSFIKELRGCEPVRSPIRKTNTILKDKNFMKAVELWEYIERNTYKPIVEIKNEELDNSNKYKNAFDMAYFLQNEILKEDSKDEYSFNKNEFGKVISNAIYEKNMSKEDIEKIVLKEIENISKKKDEEEKKVNKFFLDIYKNYESLYKKACIAIK